jgi:dTDP-4-amino-4,6-dideoxygalactose transaminase
MIPFLELKSGYLELKADLDAAYHRYMDSGTYVLGQEVAAFEEEYAAYCEAKYCVGVGHGLDALHLALRALDVGPGDEVIVPSNTYIATWLAVSQSGAQPIAVEPDEDTHNLNPVLISAAITSKTKAILAVNLYGQPCDYDQIQTVAKDNGLRFVIDNAQAQGAKYKGRRVGGLADVECHSFYPSKNLGAFGEAGAITTNDGKIADKVRVLRNYGSRVRYHNEVSGYNSRIDALQAAFLRVKLRHLEAWNERRAKIASIYIDSLRCHPIDKLSLPVCPEWALPAWHLFVIKHPRRDELQKHLLSEGIGTLVHYPIPPHLSEAYGKDQNGDSKLHLPVAEKLATSVLSLPIGPHLKTEDVYEVIESIKRFK